MYVVAKSTNFVNIRSNGEKFYTTFILVHNLHTDILIKHKTDTTSTKRTKRKEMPTQMTNKKLKKGEFVAFQRGKVLVVKWKDKKEVLLL